MVLLLLPMKSFFHHNTFYLVLLLLLFVNRGCLPYYLCNFQFISRLKHTVVLMVRTETSNQGKSERQSSACTRSLTPVSRSLCTVLSFQLDLLILHIFWFSVKCSQFGKPNTVVLDNF